MDRTKKANNIFLREPHKIERPQKVCKEAEVDGSRTTKLGNNLDLGTHSPVFTMQNKATTSVLEQTSSQSFMPFVISV